VLLFVLLLLLLLLLLFALFLRNIIPAFQSRWCLGFKKIRRRYFTGETIKTKVWQANFEVWK